MHTRSAYGVDWLRAVPLGRLTREVIMALRGQTPTCGDAEGLTPLVCHAIRVGRRVFGFVAAGEGVAEATTGLGCRAFHVHGCVLVCVL